MDMEVEQGVQHGVYNAHSTLTFRGVQRTPSLVQTFTRTVSWSPNLGHDDPTYAFDHALPDF